MGASAGAGTTRAANIDAPDRAMCVGYWPNGRRYYPTVEPLDFEANGDWTARVSVVGQDDVGVGFDLIVVVASRAAQERLDD